MGTNTGNPLRSRFPERAVGPVCVVPNSTKITISEATPVPTTVRGNSATGVSQARQAARAFTDRLVPTPCPDVAGTLVLVVSELVTNALRHGDGTFTLRLNAHPGAIEV